MNNKKRGVTVYISWVLVLLLVVILSAILYNWYIKRVQSSSETLKEITDKELCNSVGVNIESLCQNTQSLNINITNTRDITINQVVFGFSDIYNDPETKKKNITIESGETARIEILKQGTLGQVEITPVIFIDNKDYYCKNSKVYKNNIKQC